GKTVLTYYGDGVNPNPPTSLTLCKTTPTGNSCGATEVTWEGINLTLTREVFHISGGSPPFTVYVLNPSALAAGWFMTPNADGFFRQPTYYQFTPAILN
ncbi:hypothetical protein KAZ57_03190, partial [Patescibacteria group bacterium]|nr:hypothetical protein [Patescibacteria group bacterium]